MERYLYQDLYQLEDIHWWHRAKRDRVVYFIKKFRPKNAQLEIADIGCGTGKNVEAFSSLGTVWGVDPSSDAIAFCKKRNLKFLKKGSIEKTGFTAGALDCVSLLDVLEHIDDEDKAIKELRRILRKNGLLILTVPAFQFLWSQWDVVLHHKRRYTTAELTALLQKHGFEIKKISYMYPWLVLPALVVRTIKSKQRSDGYASDFQLSSPLVNILLTFICKVEQLLLAFTNFPFGTSIICVAIKKGT